MTVTQIIHYYTTQAFDMAQTITLAHLRIEENVLLDSSCPEGFIGIGVTIGNDSFVRSFVAN
jgi:hypothetical protein